MIANAVEKNPENKKNRHQIIVFFPQSDIFFYPIIGEIFHKPSLLNILYLTLGFQHINYIYTDFECIYNNLEHRISDSNTKRHIIPL